MSLQHCAFAIPPDLPPNVPISNAKHPSITPSSAKCSCVRMRAGAGKSDSMAAQMEPGGRSAAPGNCCAACSWMRMQTCCTGNHRLRLQAIAVPRTAKHCNGNEGLKGWSASLAGMSKMQLAANAGLLQREQPAANAACCRAIKATGCGCRLLPCHEQRSTAAVTKPDRAGVHRLQG